MAFESPDYSNYGIDYTSGYDSQLSRQFSDIGEDFAFDMLVNMRNIRNLIDQLKTGYYDDFQNIYENHDPNNEYSEDITYDPRENLIHTFILIRPNEGKKIQFKWDTPHFIEYEEENDFPQLFGDFIDDKDVSDNRFGDSQSLESIWKSKEVHNVYDLPDYENSEIEDQPDFLFYHFPIHYILICFGFTLLFTMLFVLRRRQMIIARARARRQAIEDTMTSNRATFVVAIPKSKESIVVTGQNDSPPTYTEAVQIKVEDESDDMLPKYKDVE